MSNQNYKRYDDTPGVESTPQPSTTPGTVDPGSTWETKPYENFNGDYKRYDEDNVELPVQPAPNGDDYVRYSDTPGVPAPLPQPYVRTP